MKNKNNIWVWTLANEIINYDYMKNIINCHNNMAVEINMGWLS